ncbi:leucine-rich repeat-containing protein 66 [Dipodomys merriami]|uniref:leucine-rich repeat-containing protein 66 n=1 Tax=Dipodomys merriami TaxID=94247 RepID=UPI003855686D
MMKNLSIATIVTSLVFTGIMAEPSRETRIFSNSEDQWNEYLPTNCSFTGEHFPPDESEIVATVDVSFHFLKVLFHSPTKQGQEIEHLDPSNDIIWKIISCPLEHVHALEILNLSDSVIYSNSLDLPGPHSSQLRLHRSSLQQELPFLKVLILQRNKLRDIPTGLWKLKSLQSLDLSFNGILQVGVSDFHSCLQLEHIYLKSNKIFKIHPEAFKDLKKLKVVDLSNNALTTILPVMIIALEFPHLEVNVADNKWQCDDSFTVFQSCISESWRKTWDVICNKSIGNEDSYSEIPKSRTSREIHLSHTNQNPVKSLIRSKAERPGEGMYLRVSPLMKDAPVDSDLREKQTLWPRGIRNTWDVRATGEEDNDNAPDLALAVCLSVFITFILAFCLGFFIRPYIDRLWRQRCTKSPSSNNTYSNEGFYDEIEASSSTQHPRKDLHPAFHQNLYKNQNPSQVTLPTSYTTIIPDGTLGNGRKEPGRWQSTEQCGNKAGSRSVNMLPNGQAHLSPLCRHPKIDNHQLISSAQDHIYRNDMIWESDYDTVAQEYSPPEHSVSVSPMAGTFETVCGTIHHNFKELDLSHLRKVADSPSRIATNARTQGSGESKRRCLEGLSVETTGPHMECSKEIQGNNFISLPYTQHPGLLGANTEKELPDLCSADTYSDPENREPSTLLPRWRSGLQDIPAPDEPVQKDVPFGLQYGLESDYDSDEGSLFTFSSEGSEDTRSMTKEEGHGEGSGGASQPPQIEDSEEHKDNVTSVEHLEDSITFQKILEKYETEEDHFGKPPISRADSGLCETHLQGASNISVSEDALIWPRSLDNIPLSDETGVFACDYDRVLQPGAVEWQCSLRDLKFANVDNLPPTPPPSTDDPTEPAMERT